MALFCVDLPQNLVAFEEHKHIRDRTSSGMWLSPCHWRFSRCDSTGCWI